MGLQLRREPSRKVQVISTLVVAMALVAQSVYGVVSTQIAQAVAPTNVVVTPDDLNGWTAVDDNGNGGSLNYITGPTGAPLGNGSAQLKVTNPSQGYMIYKSDLGSTKLSDLSALSYKTYVQTGNNLVAPTLQLNIDRDTTDANNSWQGRLVYEPYMNGSVLDGQWQSWDATAGKWWLTKPSAFDNQCGQGSPCTISQLTALFANIGINGGANAGMGFKAGSSWTSFTGNIDAFTVNDKTYDFEPALAPNGLKFTATNLDNTAVSGCSVVTSSKDVVAHWNAKGTKYNYRSWTNAAGSAYNSEATAYVSSNLGTNSQAGALNQGEGDYWFEVQAIVANDNATSWSASCKITYDKTVPTAPALVSPANNDKVKGTSVTQSWTNGGSVDVDHYVYESYHNAGLTNLRWRENISSTSKTANNVANATYWWRVKAVDHAGNSSPWSEVRKLTIDNTKPTAELLFPNIGQSAKSFKVKFSESMNLIDVVNPDNYFLHNWPGGGTFDGLAGHAVVSYDDATTTATVTFTDSNWYVSAEQNWGVRNVHDIAGNQITETSEYSTPMQAPWFGTITMHEDHNDVTWDWNGAFVDEETQNAEGGSGASGIKEYAYRLMKGDSVIEDWTITTNTSFFKHLSDGSYKFSVKSWDRAGNESGTINLSFSLDDTAPVLTMDTPVLNSDGSYTVRVTTDDPDSPVSFYLDGTLLTGATSNSDKTIWTVTTDPLDAETTHTIRAESTDGANSATPVSKQFTVPPVTATTLGALAPATLAQPTTNFATAFTQPLTQQAQTEDDDTGVLGTETKNTGTDIVPVTATPQGWKIFGIAWYWILLAVVALGSAAWWTIAAARRRAAQDV